MRINFKVAHFFRVALTGEK